MTPLGSIIRSGLVAIPLLAGVLAARSQGTSPSLDAAHRRVVVEAAAEALRRGYVFPDVGERAAEAIEAMLAAGGYDDLEEPWAFAERLTEDLAEVAHDKHLRVSARGPAAANATPPTPPPRSDGGIARADRLADNVGYIEIVSFPALEAFRPPFDRAMAALADTRALIIDARRHGGGGADAEAYLAGYFLPNVEPVAVNRFVWRTAGTETFTTQTFWTRPVPFRYLDKPLYVLTSERTFSGGEALAYDLQALDLATLVGATTGGGAHPGGAVPLGPDFGMFLPRGRGENPTTGTNWEGVGVTPDIAAPSTDALKVALAQLGVSPEASEIDALSQARLFEPRKTPLPSTAPAIRRTASELARGEPDYSLLGDGLAQLTRQQLPRLQQLFEELGPIESMRFVEVDAFGADVYEVTFAHGALSWGIVLDQNGKTVGSGIRPASPTPATPPP